MKIIKKLGLPVIIISIIYFIICLLPHVVITTELNSMIEYCYNLEFVDGYNNKGEESVEQIEEYLHGGKSFYKLNNKIVKFIYPILQSKEICCISISGIITNQDFSNKISKRELKQMIKDSEINECKITKENLNIYSDSLYFFRIYAEFSDDASFKNVYIKKYPWSKKEIYNFNSN